MALSRDGALLFALVSHESSLPTLSSITEVDAMILYLANRLERRQPKTPSLARRTAKWLVSGSVSAGTFRLGRVLRASNDEQLSTKGELRQACSQARQSLIASGMIL
jgi:hypothetical protein